jgi:hypothetical protein
MAESPEELQMLLDAFDDYCTIWKLKVNVDKTKVMIFFKRASTTKIDIFFKWVRIISC